MSGQIEKASFFGDSDDLRLSAKCKGYTSPCCSSSRQSADNNCLWERKGTGTDRMRLHSKSPKGAGRTSRHSRAQKKTMSESAEGNRILGKVPLGKKRGEELPNFIRSAAYARQFYKPAYADAPVLQADIRCVGTYKISTVTVGKGRGTARKIKEGEFMGCASERPWPVHTARHCVECDGRDAWKVMKNIAVSDGFSWNSSEFERLLPKLQGEPKKSECGMFRCSI